MNADEMCANCFYWISIDDDDRVGECRRFPPVSHPKQTLHIDDRFEFPKTGRYLFCGEWKQGKVLDILENGYVEETEHDVIKGYPPHRIELVDACVYNPDSDGKND